MMQARQYLAQYNPTQFDALSTQAINRALSGQASFDLSPETTENWFKKAVAAPMYQEYERSVAPRIKDSFAAAGSLFSSRQSDAQTRALGDMTQQMSAQLATAQMQNQALQAQLAESAANRQMAGVGMAQQQANAPLISAAALQQAASPYQQYEQQLRQSQYSEWLRTQPEQSPWIQYALGYLGQNQLAAYSQAGGSMGSTAGMLGGGLAGAGIGWMAGGPIGALIGGGIGGGVGGIGGSFFD